MKTTLIILAVMLGTTLQAQYTPVKYRPQSDEHKARDESIRLMMKLKFKSTPQEIKAVKAFQDLINSGPPEIKAPVNTSSYSQTSNTRTVNVCGDFDLDLDNNSVSVPQHETMFSVTSTKGSSVGYISIIR